MSYKKYEFHYHSSGVIQEKILIPHSVYLKYKSMPKETKEEESEAKKFLKGHTGGMEWFTEQSPLFEAISTGILIANGSYSVTINLSNK